MILPILVVIVVAIVFALMGFAQGSSTVYNDGVFRLDVYENVLTPVECDDLLAAAKSLGLKPSTVASIEKCEQVLDDATRRSSHVFVDASDSPVAQKLYDTARALLREHGVANWETARLEKVQVVEYVPGGYYVDHYDSLPPDIEPKSDDQRDIATRTHTLVVYLNECGLSGATSFPRCGTCVYPDVGRAVLWNNTDKEGRTLRQALHAGTPPEGCCKYIGNVWIHA